MTLEDEIAAVEEVVRVARDGAAQHRERAAKDLPMGSATLAHYQDFLDATVRSVEAILARCSELAAAPADTSAGVVHGLLASVRESVRLLYVTMSVIEDLAGSAPGSAAPRSCSFCGRTEAETKLVAGPAANICADCTRLACGVLGILPSSG
jgi:hypothetical protein